MIQLLLFVYVILFLFDFMYFILFSLGEKMVGNGSTGVEKTDRHHIFFLFLSFFLSSFLSFF